MDDILLMAYVDGELTPCERNEVERAISVSDEIAGRVALFEASALPYRRAFRHQQLPPVPDSLTRKIAELAHLYASSAGTDAASHSSPVATPSPRIDTRTFPNAAVRARFRVSAPWLAVAFAAGVFCCGVALRVVQSNPQTASLASASPWVMAAVEYQRLYTRDTVAFDRPDSGVASHIVEHIRRDDGVPIRIPDLRSLGLTFKRVQRLRFDGKPLIQIVYLPEKGSPVALCVVKDERADTAPAQQRLKGMDLVTWRQARLGYALIASPNNVDLDAISKQIFADPPDQIVGQAVSPYQSLGS